jgi:hypothetical protein
MFAPEYGITEDPATDSSTGPLAAYMIRHELVSGQRVRASLASRERKWAVAACCMSRFRERITEFILVVMSRRFLVGLLSGTELIENLSDPPPACLSIVGFLHVRRNS